MYISVSRFEKDWPSYLHTHDLAELFYVVDGTGEITVEDSAYPVRANDMVLIQPNARHRELSSVSEPLEYLVVGIRDLRFMPNPSASVSNQFCTLFNVSRQQRVIKGYYEMIRDELHHADENSPRMLRNIVDMLLVLLVRTFDVRFFSETGRPRRHDCFKTKAYIDAHFKEPLSLDLLSEISNTSKFYLARSFSKEFGTTPMQYLASKRMEEARSLLVNTDMSIESIAETIGYASASHFAAAFRLANGASPRKWRLLNRR